MSDTNTFGRAVTEARKRIGLSQKELAARILKEDGGAISAQYLNDIEHDRRNAPPEHLIQQFARELALQADFLIALAGTIPKDIHNKVSKATPEIVENAFRAFRRELKSK